MVRLDAKHFLSGLAVLAFIAGWLVPARADVRGVEPFGHSAENIKAEIQRILGCDAWEPSLRGNAISCPMGTTPFEVSLSIDAEGLVRVIEMSIPIDNSPGYTRPIGEMRARLVKVMRYLDEGWDERWITESVEKSVEEEFRAIEIQSHEIAIIQHMSTFNQIEGGHLASVVLLDSHFLEGNGTLNRSRNLADYFYAREDGIALRRFGISNYNKNKPPEYAFTPVCVKYRNREKGIWSCP